MSVLNPTAGDRMVDAEGRPYFLWDVDMTVNQFQAGLRDPDPDVRAYLVAKLMRQAKPDDVFLFVRVGDIVELWPRLERFLGRSLPMWRWLLEQAFCRLRVARASEVVVVDLVADPVPAVAAPAEHALEDVRILVDPPHEILVTKLCALLSRSELRDLEDVRALLDAGGDLEHALADAPRKEASFSPVTLAWVLEQLPIAAMRRALGRAEDEVRGLEAFRQKLVGEILTAAKPN